MCYVGDHLRNIHRLEGDVVELQAIAEMDWLLNLLVEAGIQEGACKSGYRLSDQPKPTVWLVDRITWRRIIVWMVSLVVHLRLLIKKNIVSRLEPFTLGACHKPLKLLSKAI